MSKRIIILFSALAVVVAMSVVINVVSARMSISVVGDDISMNDGKVSAIAVPTGLGDAVPLGYLEDALDAIISSFWVQNGTSIYYNTGNVGIGATAPDSKLHIWGSGITAMRITGGGSGYTNAELILEATSDTNTRGLGVFMHDAGGDTEWFAGTPYSLSDQYQIGRASSTASHSSATAESNNAFLTIKNNGNVGIGTTVPNAGLKLDVEGNVGATAYCKADVTNCQTIDDLLAGSEGTPSGEDGYIQYNNEGSFGGESAFYYDDANNRVGIGTATPDAILQVYNSVGGDGSGLLVNSGQGSLNIWGGGTSGLVMDVRDGSRTGAAGDFYIRSGGSDSLFIKSTGNVGIGTTNPLQKLQVAGNIAIQAGGYIDDDTTAGGNSDDWLRFSGYIELKSNTDSYGIVLRDKDASDYLGMTQVNGSSYLTDSGAYSNYFLKGDYIDATIGRDLFVRGGLSTYDLTVDDNTIETGKICLGNGVNCRTSWSTGGDNLGNHSATQNLDMNKYQMLEMRIQNVGTGANPPAPAVGQMWICTDAGNDCQ